MGILFKFPHKGKKSQEHTIIIITLAVLLFAAILVIIGVVPYILHLKTRLKYTPTVSEPGPEPPADVAVGDQAGDTHDATYMQLQVGAITCIAR